MGHLLKSPTTGHLIRDSDGHLLVKSSSCCYRQARACSNDSLVDLWLPTSSIPSLPYYVNRDADGLCYYFDPDDPTWLKKCAGTAMGSVTSITNCSDPTCTPPTCDSCLPCCYSTDSTCTVTWTISAQSNTGQCLKAAGVGCPAANGTVTLPFDHIDNSNPSHPQVNFLDAANPTNGLARFNCADGHWIATFNDANGCGYQVSIFNGLFGGVANCEEGSLSNHPGSMTCKNIFPVDNSTTFTVTIAVNNNRCCRTGSPGSCGPGAPDPAGSGACA